MDVLSLFKDKDKTDAHETTLSFAIERESLECRLGFAQK